MNRMMEEKLFEQTNGAIVVPTIYLSITIHV